MTAKHIYQFRIALKETEPAIWRRILVPAEHSFWDLHVAVQDAMGWMDCHLHVFEMPDAKAPERTVRLGIPGELFDGCDDDETLPGWDHRIADYFTLANARAAYEYDFGDGWEHDVVLEDILPRAPGLSYPRCVAGERACPPEDVGGVSGYEEFLGVIADPRAEEHEETKAWVGGSFDPERFAADEVEFDDPQQRWEHAFGETEPEPQVFRIEGFSAQQIHSLVVDPFAAEHSPLLLHTDLEEEVFEAAPFVRDSGQYLRMLAAREPLKLTQRGNLPQRFVSDLVDAGVLCEDEYWFQYKRPSKEGDSQYLTLLNLHTARSGLTRKLHGKLLLTKKGAAFAAGERRRGELFRHLFEYHAVKFNWAYSDGYPESPILQSAFAYTLFLLQRHGEESRPPEFYAQRFLAAFPMALRDFLPGRYGTPEEEFTRAYEVRSLTRFAVRFGLALQEDSEGTGMARDMLVRKTPLLDCVVAWSQGVDSSAEPHIIAGPWQETPSPVSASLTPADPSIETALDEFLAAQCQLRSPATVCRYEEALDLLGDYLDGYAHQQLSEEEHALFMRHADAEGLDQRDFCELFGPDKIPPAIDGFLRSFTAGEVMGSAKMKKTAESVCEELNAWLQEKGYAQPGAEEEAEAGTGEGAEEWEPDDEVGGRLIRKGIEEAVEEQVESGDPPAAREALERLLGMGYSEADARILIGRVLTAEMFEIMKQEREHDAVRYASGLKALPRLIYEE